MSLLDRFEWIRIVNLRHRADRRHQMLRQLRRIGIEADGHRVAFHKAFHPEERGEFESAGSRGCFTSQLGVLREAAKARVRTLLLLEDDVNFAPDFAARWEQISAGLASRNWRLFYGTYRLLEPAQGSARDGLLEAAPGLRFEMAAFVGFDSTAIGATVEFLETLLSRPGGDPRGGPMHVDGAYQWLRRSHPEWPTLLAVPPLGYQRSSRSDIATDGRLERLPVARLAHRLLGGLRNRQLWRRTCRQVEKLDRE